jgi:hypothetical protein
VILMELSPSARLMVVRKYADSCERNGLDMTELRALGAALDLRPVIDDDMTEVRRKRQRWAAASREYAPGSGQPPLRRHEVVAGWLTSGGP